jgi:putative membrane protein
MKTLVLNVDRDDDFGRKAKISSPIIGLNANIDAANKLGQIDPEDSDLNAIFSAISIYNKLIDEKRNAEIATICGNINVGLNSDLILSKQLEDVIKRTNVDNVILVSDGAEDEYILPIVQSRIKITSIKRVSVKQSRQLEDTYIKILKMLDDEKVLKQFFLPVALVLIVWAFFIILDMTASGFGAMLFTLGLYLLIRVFKLERNINFIWDEIKSGILNGRLSIYTYSLALVILIAFGFFAYNNSDFELEVKLIPILSFVNDMIWGIVIAGLITIFGRVADIYVRDRKHIWNYWLAPFSLFAFGFISSAVFQALYKAFLNWPIEFNSSHFLTIHFIGYTSTGIMIAIVGATTNHYIKEIHPIGSKKIENKVTNLFENN